MGDHAYKSSHPDVIKAWEDFLTAVEFNRQKRSELEERFGRRLMVNRRGFGHGTRVVGFERFDTDKNGDVVQGILIAQKTNPTALFPYLRTKAGREFALDLNNYNSPEPNLPGMVEFHLGGEDGAGIRVFAPALFRHENTVYALWGMDMRKGGGYDLVGAQWEEALLSEYYSAKEMFDADHS